MKTAASGRRNSSIRIVIAALVMTLSGCATTGPDAPRNNRESASGAVGGALGAVAGGTGGAALGALAGLAHCGPAAIVCSPVAALVMGVQGAAKGGEAGANAGVRLSRSRAAPESAANAPEPAAPPRIAPSALADALGEAASKGELAAGPLRVLVIGMSHGAILHPAFIEVDNIESAAGTVARLVQSNFITPAPGGPLEKPQQRSEVIWACMIASDGNRVELHFGDGGAVERRYQERVSPVFRSEVKAVMGNMAAYRGGYVCGLQFATGWPDEVRSRIVAFVDGMAAPDDSPLSRVPIPN